MLNRAALLVRYRQPFVDWINRTDPTPSHSVTLADLEDERTVYLVEVEDEEGLEIWLRINHRALFEDELRGWYTDPALWPSDRSLKVMREWCSFQIR